MISLLFDSIPSDSDSISKLQTHAPIVHVLYYHSREGAQNLAHLRAVAPKAGWTLTVR